ncbi:MAG: MurR/RpiR family transcriptional regulator [Phycisphaerales bacterium]|nr:MurR/RpiR family transcriptional regulator [Phycisphaerales bacterium]
MSIQDLIAEISDRLTPTERRVAALVLEDPTLLAFGTVSDLANRAQTSRPSIVRFATKLGFDGYTDLQSWIREELSHQLSSPSHRIRQQDGAVATIRAAIENSIHETFAALDERRLNALATPIAKARNVWILSGETSMAGAVALHSGLSMIRPDVHLVQEHSTGRQLSSATKADTAVVFDFARYRRNSITSARALAKIGVKIVAITDGPLSPLASLTKTWCELKIPAVGPFDSSIPAVMTAELLVAQVVKQLGTEAHKRIDRLEELWQTTGTFLHYSPRVNRTL